ncbi:hypothetical protein KX816_08220 [Sphingosinicellaceae bacterium]|nr:hypothetical protein KX816_08220 [Sphingosinicellaceae bacterium]
MTFTDFEEKILIGLYQERTVFGVSDMLPFQDLVDKYGLDSQTGWLIEAQKNLLTQGLITGPRNGYNDQMALGLIAGPGMKLIEQRYGDKDGVGMILGPITAVRTGGGVRDTPTTEPSFLTLETGGLIELEGQNLAIDSTAWTGVSERLRADPIKVQNITTKIRELDQLVDGSGLTNTQVARVKAITESLVKLVESPEPEWEAIALLLRSPTLQTVLGLAGVTQLVLKIMFGIG